MSLEEARQEVMIRGGNEILLGKINRKALSLLADQLIERIRSYDPTHPMASRAAYDREVEALYQSKLRDPEFQKRTIRRGDYRGYSDNGSKPVQKVLDTGRLPDDAFTADGKVRDFTLTETLLWRKIEHHIPAASTQWPNSAARVSKMEADMREEWIERKMRGG